MKISKPLLNLLCFLLALPIVILSGCEVKPAEVSEGLESENSAGGFMEIPLESNKLLDLSTNKKVQLDFTEYADENQFRFTFSPIGIEGRIEELTVVLPNGCSFIIDEHNIVMLREQGETEVAIEYSLRDIQSDKKEIEFNIYCGDELLDNYGHAYPIRLYFDDISLQEDQAVVCNKTSVPVKSIFRCLYENNKVTALIKYSGVYEISIVDSNSFEDVGGHFSEVAVNSLKTTGMLEEYGSVFQPDMFMTQGEFLDLLLKSLDFNENDLPDEAKLAFQSILTSDQEDISAESESIFNDFGIAAMFLDLVELDGFKKDSDAAIRRIDCINLIGLQISKKELYISQASTLPQYSDYDIYSDEQQGSINLLTELGILSENNLEINGHSDITRAEAVQLIYDFIVWRCKN